MTDKETGEAIAGARIFLPGINLATTSSPVGEYLIKNIPPGNYNVKINMSGYNSVIIEAVKVIEKLTTIVNFDIEILHMEERDIPQSYYKTPLTPYDSPPEPIGGFSELQRNIAYPEIALRAGVEGTVEVDVLVDKDGTVLKTQIARSLGNNGCDEAAMAAIKKTKWKPAIHEDKPVKVWISIPVIFRLSEGENEKINRPSDPQSQTPMFVPYDQAPEPVGGQAEMQKYLHYPEIAKRAGVQGTVIIQCLIDTFGIVVKTKVAKSLGPYGCDEAAANAIKSISWKPAKQGNKPVKVWVSIPTIFKLKEQSESLGKITGIVTDKDGKPVKKAMVFIEGAKYNKQWTDEKGNYSILNIKPGDKKLICGIPFDEKKYTEEFNRLMKTNDPEKQDETEQKIIEIRKKLRGEEFEKKVVINISLKAGEELVVNLELN